MKQLLSLASIFIAFSAIAQKPPLTHDVYDGWNNIQGVTLSADGKYTAVQIDPQEGDGRVLLFQGNKQIMVLERATQVRFSNNGKYLFAAVKPLNAETRKAKLAKKKKDELPKDVFIWMALPNGMPDTIKDITGFETPEKIGDWVAIKMATKKKEKKKPADGEKTDSDNDGDETAKKDAKGFEITLLNPETGAKQLWERVSEYTWADTATYLLFATEAKDSTIKAMVRMFKFADASESVIDSGKTAYKNLSCHPSGKFFCYMGTPDSAKAKIKTYEWTLYRDGKKRWTRPWLWNDTLVISHDYTPVFDVSGERLYFGISKKPVEIPEDTTTLPDEQVKLDVWSWQDPLIQPMQLKQLDRDKKRSYRVVYLLKDNKFIQLTSDNIPEASFSRDQPTDWIYGWNDQPYLIRQTWESSPPRDLWLLHTKDGKKRRIAKEVRSSYTSVSPFGKYLTWYDRDKQIWFVYHIAKKITVAANRDCPYNIFQEDWDTPAPPSPYGTAGWTKDDEAFLFYDQYDLWAFYPEKDELVCLTNGFGRGNQIQLRYQRKNRDDRYRDFSKTLYLSGFHESDKSDHLYQLLPETNTPAWLFGGPFRIQNFQVAEKAEVFVHRRGSFTQYPEVYRSVNQPALGNALTRTNPQQQNYNWGSVELVSWTSYNGLELEGMVYKPEDFDSLKQYPLLVYFYETNSENLHRHSVPQPAWSIINIPYYVSNGYVVFVPDIRYQTGYPGQSAYDCILSGTDLMVAQPWIDSTRMAIQGQSWGGYQVAYLVTQTNRYRAAMAGAPVSNMTSAYGGIRWGSGMARSFQYEQAQSRIGASLWENRDLYLENSPLFFADRVNTPLLMMHNDQDEAVPWYQGIEYYVALRRLQRPVWMLVYNGEAHNLRKRHNRKDFTIRMQQFFDHYLKDAPVPAWMQYGLPAIDKGIRDGLELVKD
jgi:dipeptidyl aminopeptidase/acylaminoacyl peptidase